MPHIIIAKTSSGSRKVMRANADECTYMHGEPDRCANVYADCRYCSYYQGNDANALQEFAR